MKIKVCGMTSIDQMHQLGEMGVEFAGMIFYPKSPRYVFKFGITGADVKKAKVKPYKVGVFVNASREEIIKQVNELRPQLQSLFDRVHAVSSLSNDEDIQDSTIEIAPLILAYTTPITLKFRQDEKRLEVDGSYNIRYSVLKKRIDKATISGTKKRLTQPDSISIVYTQEEEAAAYEKHLHYLAKKGLIQKEWDLFELEPMHGVEGLKAIRISVISN